MACFEVWISSFGFVWDFVLRVSDFWAKPGRGDESSVFAYRLPFDLFARGTGGLAAITAAGTAIGQPMDAAAQGEIESMQIARIGAQPSSKGPPDYFTGSVVPRRGGPGASTLSSRSGLPDPSAADDFDRPCCGRTRR